jgi:DNA-binding MarR family transcriptional regulator
MDVIPLVMGCIRTEMRSQGTRGLSVPQFRTLVFLYRNKGASLSEVANNIGLTLPSASKIIDALAIWKLVIRTVLPGDRRYISLRLSKQGRATFEKARYVAEASLAQRIATLSPVQQTMVYDTMQALRLVFAQTKTCSGSKRR